MNENTISEQFEDLKDDINDQQIIHKEDKCYNNIQFNLCKKNIRGKQKNLIKKDVTHTIISDEENAVNKLLAISCDQDELISEQKIHKFSNEIELIKQNKFTQISQQSYDGWGEKYQTNYYLSTLKNFGVQIQSLDDLDIGEFKNTTQKDGFLTCRSEKYDKMNGFIKQLQKIKPLQQQELTQQLKLDDQTNKQPNKIYERYNRSPQETYFENETQISNMNVITTKKCIEKSALHVKSIYYSKQNVNLTSNEKFLQMLRKSRNKLFEQQRLIPIKGNTDQNQQDDESLQKQKDVCLKIPSQETISFREKQSDGQNKELINNPIQKNTINQRKSVQNQFKSILEYYNLPLPEKQFSPKNANFNSIKPLLLNNDEYLNNHISTMKYQLNQTEKDKYLISPQQIQPILFLKKQIREVYSQPFNLKSQSQSPKKVQILQNSKDQNKFDTLNQNCNSNFGQFKGGINIQQSRKFQQLYSTSPISRNNTSTIEKHEQSSKKNQTNNSFKLKQIYIPIQNTIVTNGSENNIQQTKYTDSNRPDNLINQVRPLVQINIEKQEKSQTNKLEAIKFQNKTNNQSNLIN